MDQGISQNISSILEKLLGSGVVLNGKLQIDKLTLTSIDKAKALGLVPQQAQKDQQDSGQEEQQSSQQQVQQKKQSQEAKQKQQSQQDEQDQQEQSYSQVSREEFDSLKEELEYMRKLMHSSQDEQASKSSNQRGRGQGKQ